MDVQVDGITQNLWSEIETALKTRRTRPPRAIAKAVMNSPCDIVSFMWRDVFVGSVLFGTTKSCFNVVCSVLRAGYQRRANVLLSSERSSSVSNGWQALFVQAGVVLCRMWGP